MEAPEKTLGPILCVGTNLKMSSRVVGRAFDAVLESAGVNIVQYSILMNLARHGPLPQIKLAKHLEMERTTLYRALAILENTGLLKSRSNKVGVAKLVELTAKGRAVMTKAEAKWKLRQKKFVDKFGENKLRELNELLSHVRDHFREN